MCIYFYDKGCRPTVMLTVNNLTPDEKWVYCELKITVFTKNGLDTIANVMKMFLWSLKATQKHISKLEAVVKTLTKSFKTTKFVKYIPSLKTPKMTVKKIYKKTWECIVKVFGKLYVNDIINPMNSHTNFEFIW